MAAANFHATAIVLADRGLLLTGPSGSGKTTLALALIARARLAGRFAALISDDQVMLENCRGVLLAAAPSAIAGLAEIRGPGPVAVDHLPSARIDGILELVASGKAPRLDDGGSLMLAGIAVPHLRIAEKSAPASLLAAESWLLSLHISRQ